MDFVTTIGTTPDSGVPTLTLQIPDDIRVPAVYVWLAPVGWWSKLLWRTLRFAPPTVQWIEIPEEKHEI